MANLSETATWEAGIYQIETTDPVQGGASGVSNTQGKQLANRTKYLKDHVDAIEGQNLNTRVTDLETDSTANSDAITDLENAVGAASGVRHGIIAAKHGTGSNTEKPTFLDTSTIGSTSGSVVIEASSAVPFILSLCEGYGPAGPIVKYGIATANATVAYSQSTDMILLASVAHGVVTFSLENYYPFYYSYAEPASPSNGSYWFNLAEEKTYKREGGAWVSRNRLPIAIVSPGALSITYFKTIRIGSKDLYGVSNVPSGTIHTFAGAVANLPAGYLLCDGGEISRTTYSRLFQAIGTTYGVGNGTTTFVIPDLRGEFLRGLDNSRGIDTGRTLGSAQADELKSHSHVQRYTASSGPDEGYSMDNSNNPATQVTTSVTTASTGGAETRPRNIAMNFIIKF